MLEHCEHMLDLGANDRFLGIGAGRVLRHWLALGFLLVDARGERLVLEPCLIGL